MTQSSAKHDMTASTSWALNASRNSSSSVLVTFGSLRAAFPAGTVSGAPKVRAMAAIAEREAERRGPYGGAIGFFSPNDVEAAITLRSAVIGPGQATVHAGAGIVADSEPGYETRETEAKAGAVWRAIELACGQTDWA